MHSKSVKKRILVILLMMTLVLPITIYAADDSSDSLSEEVITKGEISSDGEDLQVEEPADTPVATETEPGFLQNITIEENPTGTVDINWDVCNEASYYKVSSPQINDGAAVRTEDCSQVFTGLRHGVDYDFIIDAYDNNDVIIAQGVISIKTVAYSINFLESQYRKLSNRIINPKRFKINLRTMIKEKRNGYAVVQGGCTDGTYAYYLMVSSRNQKGRVLKVRIRDRKVMARSGVLNTWHGNGMTYDSKRKKLVVIAREHRKQEITVIDASSLRITRQQNVRYDYYEDAERDSICEKHQEQGLAAIAYVAKYDCYVVLERTYNNLLIFDPDTFQAIGMAYTRIKENYPGTFQAMDADEKYVYLLLSYYNKEGRVQPYNIILALDWNSENLLPVVNASKSKDLPYVEKAWNCNNDGSGRPDAVIRLRTKYEAENIYHTTDKNGKEHFYLSEYYSHPVYKTVRKKVKVNGKWKRRKVKKLKYYNRDNYVYDLGIL